MDSTTTAVIVLGALLALGLLQLRWMLFPPAPDLAAEVAQWRRGRERATDRAETPGSLSPVGRLARWVVDLLKTYRPEVLDQLAPDLAVTQRELMPWLTRVVGLVLVFGLGPIALSAGRRLQGEEISVLWPPVAGLVLAVAAVVVSVKDLRTQAARARDDYTQALSTYLDLVAMSMEAGQGHAQALPAAAQIGTRRTFDEIRTAITLAPSRGISSWEALGQLGERYRIPELISLRSSIELAQDDGARVKASLIARAQTMRSGRLAAAVERANKATETMRQLTVVAAILAAVYIAAPYVLALRTAAGGG